jgi:hypothetical protein
MKGVNFDYNGKIYRLSLTAGALFDIYDIFGSETDILEHITPQTAKGWNNACRMLEILSRWGELQRRHMGDDMLPYLKSGTVLIEASPTDVRRIKDAIRAACAVGFSRSFEEGTHEVDLVLQQLDEKKTPASSARPWLAQLRGGSGFQKKKST